MARSGYVSLLQPQDRRSPSAGDSKAAVDARARLLGAGVGRRILGQFIEQAASLSLPSGEPVVLDLGSGSGDALDALAHRRRITGVGIDLSKAAAERASRRFPSLTWVVANADRQLPILSGSVALVLSFHGRRLPGECARVLAPSGFLLAAIPADDDLIELRARVQGAGTARGRAERLLDEHKPLFTLVARSLAHERHHLEQDALRDLLRGTYRGERASAALQVEALEPLDVTLASELFLFERRRLSEPHR